MIFFDTHYHHKSGEDHAASVESFRSQMNNADKLCMIALGGSKEESLVAQQAAESSENVWFCAGVHPHCAAEFLAGGKDWADFESHPKCCGAGEIGLDYYYDFSEHDAQIEVFKYFLDRALEKNMPAVIHIRDKEDSVGAYEDAYGLLAGFAADGGCFELHSYAGNIDYLERFAELGAFFSVNGMVTFKKADNIRENLKKMPIERLLIETDSPYLAPVPFRGRENNPSFIQFTAQKVADELEISLEKLCAVTTANAEKFFNVKVL